MPWYVLIILLYLLAVNLVAVMLTIYDKKCAQRGRWRVSETTLLSVSAFGGAVGMYITMRRIRQGSKEKIHAWNPCYFLVGTGGRRFNLLLCNEPDRLKV